MRTLIFILGCLLAVSGSTQAQNAVAKKVQSMQTQFDRAATVTPFTRVTEDDTRTVDFSDIVSEAQVVKIIPEALQQIKTSDQSALIMDLPVSPQKSMKLQLYEVEVMTPEGLAYASSGPGVPVKFDPGKHYRGIVQGNPESLVAVSIYESEVAGMVATKTGNIVIGKLEGNNEGFHVIYNDKDLLVASTFDCATEDDGIGYTIEDLTPRTAPRDQGDCVRVYVEIDEDIVESTGSVVNAISYILSIFHESFTIYANENVIMKISEIYVWDTPGPYRGITGSQSNMLRAFQDRIGEFNGDIGHLLSYKTSGGVAAGIQGLCNSNWDQRKCFSSILEFHEPFPEYSWNIDVVTHEMGHLLGSWHTHACVWNGNDTAIDGCAGSTTGSCELPESPPEGGTIMSYCHLDPVGKNFSLGFGPQPGTVIRNSIIDASCLSPCSAAIQNDIGISNILSPVSNYCGETIIPEVALRNYGTNTITSATIYYTLDGAPEQSVSWSGSLSSGFETNVVLPAVMLSTEGAHEFSARTSDPDGVLDTDAANDEWTKTFGSGSNQLTLTIQLGEYPHVVSWSILNGNEVAVASGGPYSDAVNGETVVESVCVPDGCFKFVIIHHFGLGVCCENATGYYELVQDSDGMVLASGSDFGDKDEHLFCTPSTEYWCGEEIPFVDNPLTLQGTGTVSTTLNFDPPVDFPVFLISDIDYEDKGNPNFRYDDILNVKYIDHAGNEIDMGTTSGYVVNNSLGLDYQYVPIQERVQSVTVTLGNNLGDNANVSVGLSSVQHCAENTQCPDSDNDSVCDDDDICPGGDDNEDTDNDGIPDFCDACVDSDSDGVCDDVDICLGGDDNLDTDGDSVPDYCDVCPGGDDTVDSDGDGIPDACDNGCTEVYMDFDPLSHSGSGQSSVSLTYGSPQTDIAFTISGINQKLNGNPNTRYIEEVRILVEGIEQLAFSGSTSDGTEDILIAGPANDIEVVLFDSYDGVLEQGSMSVSLSQVTSCDGAGAQHEGVLYTVTSTEISVKLYPNPTSGQAFIEFSRTPEDAEIVVMDVFGRVVASHRSQTSREVQLDLNDVTATQLLLVTVRVDGQAVESFRLLKVE